MSAVNSRTRNVGSASQGNRTSLTKTKGKVPHVFRNKKVVVTVLIAALGITYLIFSALQSSTMYYMTVSEIKAKGETVYGQPLRAGGDVVDGTIDFDQKTRQLRFTMTDGQETIKVVYSGIVPDTFKADVEAIVEGKFNGSVFEADNLLAKCPSKYIPGT